MNRRTPDAPPSREFSGTLVVPGPIERAFELFSPLGERAWVPGWDPELLYPPGVDWARGQIFRTREETGEAAWVVTDLDHGRHFVEYHRVEPQRYVARIRVHCSPRTDGRIDVATSYAFIGLSPRGNEDISRMTAEAYVEKMRRWEGWIETYLAAM